MVMISALAAHGDSLSRPWHASVEELVEKERKFLSSTPSGINRSATGLVQIRLSSTQHTQGWQRSKSIPSSAKPFRCVAGGNMSDVASEEKLDKQLQVDFFGLIINHFKINKQTFLHLASAYA